MEGLTGKNDGIASGFSASLISGESEEYGIAMHLVIAGFPLPGWVSGSRGN